MTPPAPPQGAKKMSPEQEVEDAKAKVQCLVGYLQYLQKPSNRLSWPHELNDVIEEADLWSSGPLPERPTA